MASQSLNFEYRLPPLDRPLGSYTDVDSARVKFCFARHRPLPEQRGELGRSGRRICVCIVLCDDACCEMKESVLAQRLGLKYPILQAPIGSLAGVDLASAVSNSGGLGSLALAWTPPEKALDLIKQVQNKTFHPFFVNYVLSFPVTSLEIALEAGVRIVTFSWGNPGQLIQKCHQAKALVSVQVGTSDGAKSARDSGADFIICQGVEAGGHVQSTTPLLRLVEETVHVCDDVPIVAAGGLVDGKDMAKAFQAGADAVMLGTRFITTVESRAHPLYKQMLVEAKSEDAVLSLCFNGGWANAPHRVLRNSTLKMWEDAGCPPAGSRPGEGEHITTNSAGKTVRRYDDMPPAFDMEGDISACCLYAGQGCGKIESIPTVAELLPGLWSECLMAE